MRVTGLAPVSACHSAAVLKTAVFAFHHTRIRCRPPSARFWTLSRWRGLTAFGHSSGGGPRMATYYKSRMLLYHQ